MSLGCAAGTRDGTAGSVAAPPVIAAAAVSTKSDGHHKWQLWGHLFLLVVESPCYDLVLREHTDG
uniref:Uncharacterized protein n=1 Tax=Peronospora matthiolae TaxID=2874970 RepID=A0AAV1VBJ2_9STRA